MPKLGISSLDRDHALEDHMLSALRARAESDEATDDEIRDLIEHIIGYTIVHTDSEALLMKLYDYPEADAHLRAHEVMLAKARELRQLFERDGRGALPAAVDRYLDWINRHIAYQDTALAAFYSRIATLKL